MGKRIWHPNVQNDHFVLKPIKPLSDDNSKKENDKKVEILSLNLSFTWSKVINLLRDSSRRKK